MTWNITNIQQQKRQSNKIFYWIVGYNELKNLKSLSAEEIYEIPKIYIFDKEILESIPQDYIGEIITFMVDIENYFTRLFLVCRNENLCYYKYLPTKLAIQ